MITLTAQMRIEGNNPYGFVLGVSKLGGGSTMGTGFQDDVQFDKRNLISFESEIKDRADIKQPSFGIISTGGSMSFKDNDSRFLTYANAGLLTEGVEIKIFLENTITKTRKNIGTYYTTDWDYDNGNRIVSVSFKDDLEEWQDIQVKGFDYDPRDPFKVIDEGKMSNFYRHLDVNYISSKYRMVSFEDLDENTRKVLAETKLQYPLLESGTLWSQMSKLCEVCGLRIYKDMDGNTTCTTGVPLWQ
jgi:hypothetical protein